jgi:hypothetical protein
LTAQCCLPCLRLKFRSQVRHHNFQRKGIAREQLLDACPGDWSAHLIVHYCSAACRCTSRDDAVKLVVKLLLDAGLDCKPPIPAVNRWNKVYPSMSWWMFGCAFYNIVPSAFAAVKAKQGRKNEVGAVHDLIGPVTEAIHRHTTTVRWNRAEVWLASDVCRKSLVMGTHFMQLGLKVMMANFAQCRKGSEADILTWIDPRVSPAYKLIHNLADSQRNPNHENWQFIRVADDDGTSANPRLLVVFVVG